jgi:hypothetical protein
MPKISFRVMPASRESISEVQTGAARKPNLCIETPVIPMHGFWIMDDTSVVVETIDSEITAENPADIALYQRVMDELWTGRSGGRRRSRDGRPPSYRDRRQPLSDEDSSFQGS